MIEASSAALSRSVSSSPFSSTTWKRLLLVQRIDACRRRRPGASSSRAGWPRVGASTGCSCSPVIVLSVSSPCVANSRLVATSTHAVRPGAAAAIRPSAECGRETATALACPARLPRARCSPGRTPWPASEAHLLRIEPARHAHCPAEPPVARRRWRTVAVAATIFCNRSLRWSWMGSAIFISGARFDWRFAGLQNLDG